MAKKRRAGKEEDDEFINDDNLQMSCTTIDHVYPANPQPDTRCFCGKRQWKPFIKLDDYLAKGMIIRTHVGGPLYEVEMVNQSRARCRLVTAQKMITRRDTDRRPVFMPMPGSPAAAQLVTEQADEEEDEKRGRIINISPRSAVIRVSAAELESEIQPKERAVMASKATAAIPVASSKQSNKDRIARLNKVPASTARPLTGAAAKAKANARPKAQKSVRPCGCGCGEETMSYFIPGHDARYKGWMKKVGDGRLSLDELKKLMGAKTFGKYTFKKSGAGFVAKESYQEAAEA